MKWSFVQLLEQALIVVNIYKLKFFFMFNRVVMQNCGLYNNYRLFLTGLDGTKHLSFNVVEPMIK